MSPTLILNFREHNVCRMTSNPWCGVWLFDINFSFANICFRFLESMQGVHDMKFGLKFSLS